MPYPFHAVLIENRIGTYEWNVLDLRLSGEQPVERVAVMPGQSRLNIDVFDIDRQQSQSEVGNSLIPYTP